MVDGETLNGKRHNVASPSLTLDASFFLDLVY
jgi:hypothetical protein